MRFRVTRVAMLTLATTLAAGGGCGSDGGDPEALTKAQVISKGGEICKAAEARVEDLPQLTSNDPFAPGTSAQEHRTARAFLSGYADLLEGSRQGLAALDAPEEGRDLLDEYLADVAEVVAGLRTAAEAPAAQVKQEADAAFARFAKASEQTKAYGFPEGVCGSG